MPRPRHTIFSRTCPTKAWRSGVSLIALLTLLFLSILLNILLLRQVYNGQVVVAVYDGDSFELENGTRVRLLGVDAPEKGRCGYQEAKDTLTAYLLGKRVRLKNSMIDTYGRVVANVIKEDWTSWTKYISYKFCRFFTGSCGPFPDPMINRFMVTKGLAKYLSVDSPYKETMADASAYAKEKQLGIFRPQCYSATAPSKCTIKGNIQQEGRYYFPPGCKSYAQVIVDRSYGDEWFCTASDAAAAGFTPAPSCK